MTPEEIGRERVRNGIRCIVHLCGTAGLQRIDEKTLDVLDAEHCPFAKATGLHFDDAVGFHPTLTFAAQVNNGFMATAACGYCFPQLTAWWKEKLRAYRETER